MKTPKEKPLKAFEDLSVIITGFPKADIVGTGLLETYFNTIEAELGKFVFENLLNAILKIKIINIEQLTEGEYSNVSELIISSKYKQSIEKIIQLWYLGEWIVAPYSDENYIISSQSYIEGLIWKAIAAHPMGGKQPGYGTWGFPPLTYSPETKSN